MRKKVRFEHAVNAAVTKRMDEEYKMDAAEIDSYIAGMIHKQVGNGASTNVLANAYTTNASSANTNVNPSGTLLKAITQRAKNANPSEQRFLAVQVSALSSKRRMNVSQPYDHEVSQEAITIRVTNHLTWLCLSIQV